MLILTVVLVILMFLTAAYTLGLSIYLIVSEKDWVLGIWLFFVAACMFVASVSGTYAF